MAKLTLAHGCFQVGYFIHELSSAVAEVSEGTRTGDFGGALLWLENVLRKLRTILEAMPALEAEGAKMLAAAKDAEDALKAEGVDRIKRLAIVDRMSSRVGEMLDEAERICSRGG